jgi:hypothetical protein
LLITKITDNFYQLTDVFEQDVLDSLNNQYSDTDTWNVLKQADTMRLETDTILNALEIHSALTQVVVLAETLSGPLYQNSPQLWLDFPGYINAPHIDLSPNLSVNIQVYLNDDVESVGTYCFDDEWYSVPFKKNCGYMLLNPTKILHGMKYPVQTQRRSLYQSYRLTKEASPIW